MISDQELIHIQGGDLILRLPLPPSTNRRLTISAQPSRINGKHFLVLERDAKMYLEEWGLVLGSWVRRNQWDPIDRYWPARFFFRLGNPAFDSHNGLKIICDTLERSGVFSNDRFILPQVMEVRTDPSNSGVDVRIATA